MGVAKTKSTRWMISNELWAKIEPLLPIAVNTHPRGGGRSRAPTSM